MDSQVFISFNITEFKALLNETVSEAVKGEVARFAEATPESDKQFLTRHETAQIIGISLPTLHLWTKSGLIDCFKIGTRVRYRLEDIKSAIKRQNYESE